MVTMQTDCDCEWESVPHVAHTPRFGWESLCWSTGPTARAVARACGAHSVWLRYLCGCSGEMTHSRLIHTHARPGVEI